MMQTGYNPTLPALSFAIAVGGTGAAFAWASRPRATRRDVPISGPLLGVGVAAMHDTGIGMTEEQVGALFQRFHQAHVSTTRRFGGTGLGLALSKAFVTMPGGALTVDSVPGQGSSFIVRLPATSVAGQPASDEHNRGAAAVEQKAA